MNSKPPFKPLTMAQIRKQEKTNGYKVVSTFSGAGGSCLGYRLSGYEVIYANEIDPKAHPIYKDNHTTYLDKRAIRQIKPKDILNQTGLKCGELDLLDGSPPCTVFSMAGSREKKWNKTVEHCGTRQRIDDLFFEYLRLVEGLKPKVFLAENVKGLIMGKSKGYFKLIYKKMQELGYNVKAKLINSLYCEVPQKRERVIFIGVRKDLKIKPVFPKPLPYYYNFHEATKQPSQNKNDTKKFKTINKKLQVYDSWKKTKPGDDFSKAHPKKYYFSNRKISKYKPLPTILTQPRLYHYKEPRTLNLFEYKRAQTFPDDFIFNSTFDESIMRIGNSVPPLMTYHLAKTIQTEILDKIKITQK